MADEEKTPAEPVDDPVTTNHTLRVADQELAYTATAGRVVLRQEVHTEDKFDGYKPKAEVFLIAYTLDGADPGTRPVTFAFNGGPGSSGVWLHLGLLGPRRVASGDAGALVPPPYRLVDNAQTLLLHSDLVFIDPVSTGYSRAATGEKPKDYHGFQGDLESVGEIIRLWTSRHGRWLSPKYLCGESYGTLRAAALAEHLQDRHGMYLNGLALISAVLDVGAEVAGFARRDYRWALAEGARLSTVDRADAVTRVARLAGLDRDYVDRVDLRIEHIRFFTELLRDKRRTVGRLDGRFLGWDTDYGREHMSGDPSYHAIQGPYTAAVNHYLRAELGYRNDLPYEVLTERVQPWSYKEFEARHVNVAPRLAAALRANPALRVYVACGYHDGATPYLAAEHTFAHLEIPDELRGNIQFHYFEAGHMMYVHEPSRLAQSRQLAEFVTR